MGKFVCAILLIAGAFFAYQSMSSSGDTIEGEGDAITITHGNVMIAGTIKESKKGSFMLFGGDLSRGKDKMSTGTLFVMDMNTANALKSKYGEFTRCNNRGASTAKKNVKNVFFTTADKEALKNIKKIMKLAKEHKRSVIELEMDRIKIDKCTFYEESQDSSMLEPYYVLRSAEILQEEYVF